MKTSVLLSVVLAVLALLLAGCKEEKTVLPEVKVEPQGPQPTLPMAAITVRDVSLKVEVATTDAQHEKGYMFRGPPKDSGMLFVWPKADYRSFHMKNVSFDLDLAYIGDNGVIFQILRMKAFRVQSPADRSPPYASLREARYALEVPAGWFKEHGIAEGAALKIPADVTESKPPGGPPSTSTGTAG